MCGIAGWVAAAPGPERGVLARMLERIAHRGPDDSGTFLHTAHQGQFEVALGHQRLAIIDPTGGRQPIVDETGMLAMVFNGEIYNFRTLREDLIGLGHTFRDDSDTEVLLRAYQEWGIAALNRLRGMFALALWDGRTEALILARDRFGKKPLHVMQTASGIYFASEIKALLEIPRAGTALNHRALWDYLCYRYVPGRQTLWNGIEKLLPGTYMIWTADRVTEHCYYQPPDGRPRLEPLAAGDQVQVFREVFERAVALRMVSDVPFGAFLSGGLDSSAVVAMMSRHSSTPINTYSVGFEEREFSELGHASVVARAFGTRHHELSIAGPDIIEHLPNLTWHRDAPVSEPADIPIYLLSREAGRSVKMVLTGEGADEILGGYPKHVFERFAIPYQRLPHWLRKRLIEPLARQLPYRFQRAKTAVACLSLDSWEERSVRWFGAFSRIERASLAQFRPTCGADSKSAWFSVHPRNSSLRRTLYFDQTSWLPDNLLERGDRMTMAASIEARMPFLDHELVETVSSAPDAARVRGMRGKRILHQAMQGILPPSTLNRAKAGFVMPLHEWLRGPMRAFLEDHLLAEHSRLRRYVDPVQLNALVGQHMNAVHNHQKVLWSLLALEVWLRRYRMG
ncbi:MAG: asparagine synthase (glutamine-hydrolyzing) [Burkholderiales bacterium]